ncbi:MAG: preprotein translocase subunit SecE [Candidatus Omnitrophica bacterium]|nr:preprotein translocase subunit SecE [Candidatus Omnitrophota bacterium]
MFGKVGNFVGETKQELNKVTWPTKNEVWQSTLVVIITVFLMAAFIGTIDFVLSMVMRVLVG